LHFSFCERDSLRLTLAIQRQDNVVKIRGLDVSDRLVAAVAAGVFFLSLAGCGDRGRDVKRLAVSEVTADSATDTSSLPVDGSDDAPSGQGRLTRIEPETIVRFPESSIACASRKTLKRAMTYAENGDESELRSMVAGRQNPDGECILLDPYVRFKVISAEYSEPDIPETGLLEIVGEMSTSRHGSWAFSVMAEPVGSSV
jgi:hypothetical protein